MIGNCRLYDIETELRQSHIYPKFTVDYLKKTGSKYLRTAINPNKREQDAFKPYLLGEKAEQEFGKVEKWFSENIFKPYLVEKKRSFDYDENLFYFTTSFLWRVLAVHLDHPNIKDKPFISILEQAFSEWKYFLRGGVYPRNFDRMYIFLTDRVYSHNFQTEGVDYYTSRALDATIVTNDKFSFIAVYGKFLRFIFWGVLKGGDESKLTELKINPIAGEIRIPQQTDDPTMTSFFMNRIIEFAQLQKPSDKQQEKIIKEIKKDPEKFWNSDAGQSIQNDFENLDKRD